MKREYMEKAALKYKSNLVERVINYAHINNEEDNYEAGKMHALDDNIEDAFKAGAEWRINSVWHDINKKKPQDGKQCLLEITYKNGYVPYYLLTQWYEMNEFVFHDCCAKVRWAYIEDSLPNMED